VGANIVHCHHYSPLVYGCLARAWRPGLRVVFTEHGRLSDAKPSARRRLVNQVLARVPDAAFAVSRELREYLVEEGFPSSRIDVIHNGIDVGPWPSAELRHAVRQRLGVNGKTFVVGTVARLDPVKDLATLIRAFSEAAIDDALLVVVGDGSEGEALQALAAELRVGGVVRFLGQRNDARDWLAGCDAYVNSSISEGVSLTILEAMAAALPVVATRVGGTPEVVNDECAHLVPARASGELAGALRSLARDPSVRERLGRAGRQRVERHFSLDRMVTDYQSVYERIV
jgi:glycosyltransferase involved in cell wall biosynthesis